MISENLAYRSKQINKLGHKVETLHEMSKLVSDQIQSTTERYFVEIRKWISDWRSGRPEVIKFNWTDGRIYYFKRDSVKLTRATNKYQFVAYWFYYNENGTFTKCSKKFEFDLEGMYALIVGPVYEAEAVDPKADIYKLM